MIKSSSLARRRVTVPKTNSAAYDQYFGDQVAGTQLALTRDPARIFRSSTSLQPDLLKDDVIVKINGTSTPTQLDVFEIVHNTLISQGEHETFKATVRRGDREMGVNLLVHPSPEYIGTREDNRVHGYLGVILYPPKEYNNYLAPYDDRSIRIPLLDVPEFSFLHVEDRYLDIPINPQEHGYIPGNIDNVTLCNVDWNRYRDEYGMLLDDTVDYRMALEHLRDNIPRILDEHMPEIITKIRELGSPVYGLNNDVPMVHSVLSDLQPDIKEDDILMKIDGVNTPTQFDAFEVVRNIPTSVHKVEAIVFRGDKEQKVNLNIHSHEGDSGRDESYLGIVMYPSSAFQPDSSSSALTQHVEQDPVSVSSWEPCLNLSVHEGSYVLPPTMCAQGAMSKMMHHSVDCEQIYDWSKRQRRKELDKIRLDDSSGHIRNSVENSLSATHHTRVANRNQSMAAPLPPHDARSNGRRSSGGSTGGGGGCARGGGCNSKKKSLGPLL